jgi:hypothetical protein
VNERIRQLAEQAGYTKDMFGIGHWDMPECQKFAELIVQECIHIAQDRAAFDWAPPNAVNHIISEIKQHFGVTE